MSLSAITCSHFNIPKMEIYQIVLMVIGAATIIYIIVKFIKGFFWILGKGMESCFREKYPYDFEINLKWVTSELELRGFKQSAAVDAGGDYPGVIMNNPEKGVEMEVRLRAPLLSDKGYSIIVANHNNKTAIVMPDSACDENRKLLAKFLD
jgi:hypothetical protein